MARTGRLIPDQEAVLVAVEASLPEGMVVVALSGGADSAALAWAVVELGAGARAVSIDHGLPGSAALMTAAARIAEQLGLPRQVIEVRSEGTSETALRTARLEALERAAGPGEIVMTAHTADDQAETVLGNLVRGAGATGLAGIPTIRGVFVRPLLGIPRSVTRAAASAAGLPFADDPVNDDPTIWRNRIRTITIPHLEEHYHPAVRAALGRAAHLIGADDLVLEERAAKVPVRRDEEAVVLPASALTSLPLPVATRVVRRALRRALSPYAGSFDDVTAVVETASTGARASLSGGLLASLEGPWVVIHPEEAPPPPEPVSLSLSGETRFGRWRIEPGSAEDPPGPMRADVPLGDGPVVVRAPHPGDRIAIAGGGHKRVADALREAGAPPRLRGRWPLVAAGDTIGWIVGVRVSAADAPTVRMSATRERP
jgi:tRNA(Ile)-lysidine synthase